MGTKQASGGIYDVAVIGGGLAGMTLSCILGAGGARVACIDPGAAPAQGDLRTTAVSFGSRAVLQRAGAWDALASSACPIDDIRILDGTSPVLLTFLSREADNKSFGWILLNSDLLGALSARLRSLDCVDLLSPATARDFAVHDGHAEIELKDGRTIRARLVVGADGRKSLTREWMGVHVREWSYRQRAIVCNVAHENLHHNRAIEHFWPAGPFAVLPMTDDEHGAHRSAIVLTEHEPANRSLVNLDDAAFTAELQERFPADYGTVRLIGRRAAYPLGFIHAAEYVRPRMALVADAAHAIHPIAGQGLNLGFRDIDELSGLVLDALQAGQDPGAESLLATYQRRRRPDNMAMAAVTDGLNRLFSNNIMPVRALRRAGLRAVARLAPARRFFMRQAMGDRG